MSRHYTPKLENSLQSAIREQGDKLPHGKASGDRYRKPSYRPKTYKRKIYENLELPCAMEMGNDGETHINTGDQAETELGRMLSQGHRFPFSHSYLGDFQCINGFWTYVTSKVRHDRVRSLTGNDLRVFSKNLESRRVDNFIYILLGAQWEKINGSAKLKQMVKDSTLPFDCYYVKRQKPANGNAVYSLRVRPRHAEWIIWGFEEIRNALKENRLPNFEDTMDDPSKDFHDCVFPNMARPAKPPEPTPALMVSDDEPEVATAEIPDDIGNRAEADSTVQEAVIFSETPFVVDPETKVVSVKPHCLDESLVSLFQEHYGDYTITLNDIATYLCSVGQNEDCKQYFDSNPASMLPNIPFAREFWDVVNAYKNPTETEEGTDPVSADSGEVGSDYSAEVQPTEVDANTGC